MFYSMSMGRSFISNETSDTDKAEEYSDMCCNVVLKLRKQGICTAPGASDNNNSVVKSQFCPIHCRASLECIAKPRIHSQAVC